VCVQCVLELCVPRQRAEYPAGLLSVCCLMCVISTQNMPGPPDLNFVHPAGRDAILDTYNTRHQSRDVYSSLQTTQVLSSKL
jgi:hypothetical protein